MLEVGHFKLLSLARRDDFWDANFFAGDDAERSVRECSELDLLLLTKHAPSKGDPSRLHVLAKVHCAVRVVCTVIALRVSLTFLTGCHLAEETVKGNVPLCAQSERPVSVAPKSKRLIAKNGLTSP